MYRNCRWCKNYSNSEGCFYLRNKLEVDVISLFEEGHVYELLQEYDLSDELVDNICDSLQYLLQDNLDVIQDIDEENFYCCKFE